MKIFLRLTAILALLATSALAKPGYIEPKPKPHPIAKKIKRHLDKPQPIGGDSIKPLPQPIGGDTIKPLPQPMGLSPCVGARCPSTEPLPQPIGGDTIKPKQPEHVY